MATYTQHSKKVGFVLFHPSAANVLATAAMDPCIKLWDIEKSADKVTLTGFKDLIVSIDWNRDGSLMGSTCRDKRLRLFDTHTGAIAMVRQTCLFFLRSMLILFVCRRPMVIRVPRARALCSSRTTSAASALATALALSVSSCFGICAISLHRTFASLRD